MQNAKIVKLQEQTLRTSVSNDLSTDTDADVCADRPVSARYIHIHLCRNICSIEDTLNVTVHVYWHEVPR